MKRLLLIRRFSSHWRPRPLAGSETIHIVDAKCPAYAARVTAAWSPVLIIMARGRYR